MQRSDVAVVCCSLDRPEALEQCVESLRDSQVQTQWIILRERGPLTTLRNRGLFQSQAPITLFVDDDIVASPHYLQHMTQVMGNQTVVGVTGPSRIPSIYRRHRLLFRYPLLTWLYTQGFVAPESRPGHLSEAGVPVPLPDWSYSGAVRFLEACHMAFRTKALTTVGGFDESYAGIGDWSEPDVGFRLRSVYGEDSLRFDPAISVEHHCATSGAYLLRRADAQQRLSNARLFAQRWIVPTWRARLYQLFLMAYYRGYQEWCGLRH